METRVRKYLLRGGDRLAPLLDAMFAQAEASSGLCWAARASIGLNDPGVNNPEDPLNKL